MVETCIQLGYYELEHGLLTDTAYCNIGIDMQWNAHLHFTSGPMECRSMASGSIGPSSIVQHCIIMLQYWIVIMSTQHNLNLT